MLGVFLAVIILKPLAAGYEYDMRFAELTKKIEGISYEYDADTTDLFTAFEAEETDYIVILLVGVLLLIVVLPVKEDKKTYSESQKKAKAKSVSESTCDDEEYEKLLEKKLEGILERIDGVGEVSVMITLSDDGTRIVDKDTKETRRALKRLRSYTMTRIQAYLMSQVRTNRLFQECLW